MAPAAVCGAAQSGQERNPLIRIFLSGRVTMLLDCARHRESTGLSAAEPAARLEPHRKDKGMKRTLTTIMLLAAVVVGSGRTLASTGRPLVEPGTPAPDNNGRVFAANAYAQLPDGRLIVGVTYTGAVSPTTGLPMSNNVGFYNYDPATGQFVQEIRQGYSASGGTVTSDVGVYDENFVRIPVVLDNGDRIYRGYQALYRFSDTKGLVYHGNNFTRYCVLGPGGIIGAPTRSRDKYYSLSDGGNTLLFTNGQNFPGISKTIQSFYVQCIGADGSHSVSFSEQNWSEEYTVRVKPGASYDTHYPLVWNDYAIRSTPFGQTGMAFVRKDVKIQSAMNQSIQTVLADGQSIRGDYRVNSGVNSGDPQGFSDGGFVVGGGVTDNRTGAFLGNSVYLFGPSGSILRSVLPDDANPFGSGTVKGATLEKAMAVGRNSSQRYRNSSAITVRVDLTSSDPYSSAYWRLAMNGNPSLEIAHGQTIPGTNITVDYATMLGYTPDARSVYQFAYFPTGSTTTAWAQASYRPESGLQLDGLGKLSSSEYDYIFGPKGSRLYATGWFAPAVGTPANIIPSSMDAHGMRCDVTSSRMYGLTPEDRPVLSLNLKDPLTGETFDVYYLYDNGKLTELLDRSQLFNGKTLSTSQSPQVQTDRDAKLWVCVGQGDWPVFSVQFLDGTSGLYVVPEPATLCILALGGLTLISRRGRQRR